MYPVSFSSLHSVPGTKSYFILTTLSIVHKSVHGFERVRFQGRDYAGSQAGPAEFGVGFLHGGIILYEGINLCGSKTCDIYTWYRMNFTWYIIYIHIESIYVLRKTTCICESFFGAHEVTRCCTRYNFSPPDTGAVVLGLLLFGYPVMCGGMF